MWGAKGEGGECRGTAAGAGGSGTCKQVTRSPLRGPQLHEDRGLGAPTPRPLRPPPTWGCRCVRLGEEARAGPRSEIQRAHGGGEGGGGGPQASHSRQYCFQGASRPQ